VQAILDPQPRLAALLARHALGAAVQVGHGGRPGARPERLLAREGEDALLRRSVAALAGALMPTAVALATVALAAADATTLSPAARARGHASARAASAAPPPGLDGFRWPLTVTG
jgi:hypothetical protein